MRKRRHIFIFAISIFLLSYLTKPFGDEKVCKSNAEQTAKCIRQIQFQPFHVFSQNTTKLYPDNSDEISKKNGMIGRLYIPDVSINVALFDTSSLSAKDRQHVVDLPDSAAIFYLGPQCVIGDHDLQGFQNIRDAIENKTVAYIQKESYTDIYICTEIRDGHNTGTTIIDKNGLSVEERNDADIIMYTCNGCWQNITYTVWEKVSAEEALSGKGNGLYTKLEIPLS